LDSEHERYGSLELQELVIACVKLLGDYVVEIPSGLVNKSTCNLLVNVGGLGCLCSLCMLEVETQKKGKCRLRETQTNTCAVGSDVRVWETSMGNWHVDWCVEYQLHDNPTMCTTGLTWSHAESPVGGHKL
jgi:hypothetical protein